MRKAESLAPSLVVVFAILFLVLIALVIIFTNKARWFTSAARSCEPSQGVCYTQSELNNGKCALGTNIRIPGTDCEDTHGTGAVCCSKIIG
jgi:hypothetical protein